MTKNKVPPFQVLTIIAFHGRLNLNTFKVLLSVGPTYAVMKFLESEYFISLPLLYFHFSSFLLIIQCFSFLFIVLKNWFSFTTGSLDILLMFGAYTTARGMAISRLVIRFFWWCLSTAAIIYFYVWVWMSTVIVLLYLSCWYLILDIGETNLGGFYRIGTGSKLVHYLFAFTS